MHVSDHTCQNLTTAPECLFYFRYRVIYLLYDQFYCRYIMSKFRFAATALTGSLTAGLCVYSLSDNYVAGASAFIATLSILDAISELAGGRPERPTTRAKMVVEAEPKRN